MTHPYDATPGKAGDSHPIFAVVGHPNQGKSSVVSTLVQDDHIAISSVSGTTREAHQYQLILDDSILYELVDTPGFQRPRQVLEWCTARSDGPAQRLTALSEFMLQHSGDPRFADDCALLRPILEGAGIIYVVDASQPFSATFEAELTLLSWTGRPRLGLLNLFGEGSHEEEWRAALQQYFSLVRTFNPLLAPFAQHLALLRTLAEIHPPWRTNLLRGAEALEQQRDARHNQAAGLLVAYLQSVLRFYLQLPMAGARDTVYQAGLKQYDQELQRREQGLQAELSRVYDHSDLDWNNEWPALQPGDLTDAREWRAWGLSRHKLTSLSAGAGALTGAGLDVIAGGASLFLGTLMGGTLGGLAGHFVGRDPVSFELISKVPGYEQWQLGPVSNLEFAMALTGRALRSWYQVRQRNHARRDVLSVESQDLSQWLEGLARRQQVQLLFWIRKLLKRSLREPEQAQLQALLLALGAQMEVPEDVSLAGE